MSSLRWLPAKRTVVSIAFCGKYKILSKNTSQKPDTIRMDAVNLQARSCERFSKRRHNGQNRLKLLQSTCTVDNSIRDPLRLGVYCFALEGSLLFPKAMSVGFGPSPTARCLKKKHFFWNLFNYFTLVKRANTNPSFWVTAYFFAIHSIRILVSTPWVAWRKDNFTSNRTAVKSLVAYPWLQSSLLKPNCECKT